MKFKIYLTYEEARAIQEAGLEIEAASLIIEEYEMIKKILTKASEELLSQSAKIDFKDNNEKIKETALEIKKILKELLENDQEVIRDYFLQEEDTKNITILHQNMKELLKSVSLLASHGKYELGSFRTDLIINDIKEASINLKEHLKRDFK